MWYHRGHMDMNKIFLPVSVIAAGLLIAGAVVWNGQRPANTGDNGQAVKADINTVNMEGAPFIGNPNAPVTIAFWSDFQCPFCRAFEVGHPKIQTPAALPQIIKDYVNTGKVKIVFMDFAFLGPDSFTAARYNHSIWKLYPEQYFAWRTAMYEAQDEEHKGFGDEASIKVLTAKIAGIDAAKVAADVAANGNAYDAMAEAEKAEAQKQGISATPSFVIGTQMLAGAYPYANFKTAIDTLLK